MSYSKCPKCDNTSFEIELNSPRKSEYKIAFVQCSSCGCVVGTMDYWNIGTKIIDLDKKVDSVNNNLDTVNQNISRLFQLVNSLKK